MAETEGARVLETPAGGAVITPPENGTPPGGDGTTSQARTASGQFGVETYDVTDWRNLLSEEVRGNPSLTRTLGHYKDLNHFVRDGIAWRSELNNRVRLPKEDAKPEDWQQFYQQLPGYPKEVKGYKELVKLPELPKRPNVPDEQQPAWQDDLLEPLYQEAFAAGMTAKQVEGILGVYARMQADAQNVYDAQMAQVDMDQQRERYTRFGANTKTEEGRAFSFFERLTRDTELGQGVGALFQEARLDNGRKLMNEPDVVQFLALATQRWIDEPGMVGLDNIQPVQTALELNEQIMAQAAIINDPKQTRDAHLAAIARIQRLHEVKQARERGRAT